MRQLVEFVRVIVFWGSFLILPEDNLVVNSSWPINFIHRGNRFQNPLLSSPEASYFLLPWSSLLACDSPLRFLLWDVCFQDISLPPLWQKIWATLLFIHSCIWSSFRTAAFVAWCFPAILLSASRSLERGLSQLFGRSFKGRGEKINNETQLSDFSDWQHSIAFRYWIGWKSNWDILANVSSGLLARISGIFCLKSLCSGWPLRLHLGTLRQHCYPATNDKMS